MAISLSKKFLLECVYFTPFCLLRNRQNIFVQLYIIQLLYSHKCILLVHPIARETVNILGLEDQHWDFAFMKKLIMETLSPPHNGSLQSPIQLYTCGCTPWFRTDVTSISASVPYLVDGMWVLLYNSHTCLFYRNVAQTHGWVGGRPRRRNLMQQLSQGV